MGTIINCRQKKRQKRRYSIGDEKRETVFSRRQHVLRQILQLLPACNRSQLISAVIVKRQSVHWDHPQYSSGWENKTNCQLSKRVAWPSICQSWSGLLWKRLLPMDTITIGQSTTILLCVRSFLAWWQTSKQPTGRSYSKPALAKWEGSLLQRHVFQEECGLGSC